MTKDAGLRPWFEGGVMYQVYPRSFADDDGDGIGDLSGIANRLDYLNDGRGGGLGVSGIWLSPFYPSPMVDFGYDVTDYCDVDPVFGTLMDFDYLLEQAHNRGIKVITDFVPNHSSDRHPWFVESRSSRDNPKRDWYIWRDAKPDGSPPNNWLGVFGGQAWQWDARTGQYYLHSFTTEQPDLNLENPELFAALKDAMRFWLKRGVDGFRIDAIDLMGKDLGLRDDPINPDFNAGHDDPYLRLIHQHSRDAGNLNLYLRRFADTVNEYSNKLIIIETWPMDRAEPQAYLDFYRAVPQTNCLPYNLELMFMKWSASHFQSYIDRFQEGLRREEYPVYALGSHDVSRLASRVGRLSARTAAMLLFTLPGLAFTYYGDELGMENVTIPPDKIKDPLGKNVPWLGRDPVRTPMQWNAERSAGFSRAEPWLPVADDFSSRNVAVQMNHEGSMLHLYQKLIGLRNSNEAIRYGNYRSNDMSDDDVVSYTRGLNNKNSLIVLNFSDKEKVLPPFPSQSKLLLSTDDKRRDITKPLLNPREGLIIEYPDN